MDRSILHEFHKVLGARFKEVNGAEFIADYGDAPAEYRNLTETAVLLDLSLRGRICLTGSDRVRFLHGQVTNDVKRLGAGEGCYAALVTAKGRMQSDLNIYCLAEELLLDFEPGLTARVIERLDQYIVADDVQVVDVSPHYGLLSVQGPQAAGVVKQLGLFAELPAKAFDLSKAEHASLGEIYLVRQPRAGSLGFDLFVPVPGLRAAAERVAAAVGSAGGGACGWTAMETARIEAGIPRFGLDMDESFLPQECGIETRAVSYGKGCYIGQEVLNRLHTLGHVNRELRGLHLSDRLKVLPQKGDKLFHNSREVGFITSALRSPRWRANIALGYVRREMNQAGTELTLLTSEGESQARVLALPFDLPTAQPSIS